MPFSFRHWDMSENSLPYPFPCFHEVCGNFTSLQPRSLSSIWLKFPGWNKNYQGGTDRQGSSEPGGIKFLWKPSERENPSGICVSKGAFPALKAPKWDFVMSLSAKLKTLSHPAGKTLFFPQNVLNLNRNPDEGIAPKLAKKQRDFSNPLSPPKTSSRNFRTPSSDVGTAGAAK